MRVLALALALGACAADGGADAGAPCPELAAETAEWTAVGGAELELCAELADVLNGGLEIGSGEGCPPQPPARITRTGDGCRAELAAECDGTALQLVCDVEPAGTANCGAVITAAEIGRCDYVVRLE